jgi:hypothetical protein
MVGGVRAILIGEHRTLYFDATVIASDWFDTPQPLPLIRETRNNDELLDRLIDRNIRYVYFNRGELLKYAARYFIPRFTELEFARFDALVGLSSDRPDRRLSEVYRDENADIRIYEILDHIPV